MIGDTHFTHFVTEKASMGVLKNVSRGRIKLKIKVLFDKRSEPLSTVLVLISVPADLCSYEFR